MTGQKWESSKIESWLFQTKHCSILIHIETLILISKNCTQNGHRT